MDRRVEGGPEEERGRWPDRGRAEGLLFHLRRQTDWRQPAAELQTAKFNHTRDGRGRRGGQCWARRNREGEVGKIHRPPSASLFLLLLLLLYFLPRRTVFLGVRRLERRSLLLLGSFFVGVNGAKDGEESSRTECTGPGRGEFWGHHA